MYNIFAPLMIFLLPFLFLCNSSLIFLWIFLEMSSIMFICMALSEEDMKKKESLLIYFLVQSFASAFLLVYLFSWVYLMKMVSLENSNNMSILITILIALKIAMGPLHFWLIKMSKLISWFVMSILLTWQKIIPLSFIMSFSMNFLMSSMCIISLLLGTLSLLKVTSMKMLIAFSSVSHLGWMVFPLLKSTMTVMIYLLIYSLIVVSMMTFFYLSNYEYLFNQISYMMIFYMSVLIFSLSGIPPLMGFLLKWMCLSLMMPSILAMMLFSLMACMSFYIYIRLIYKSFLLSPFALNQNKASMNLKMIWLLNFILPIFPILW